MGCGSSKSAVAVIATEQTKSVANEKPIKKDEELLKNESEEVGKDVEKVKPEKTNSIIQVKNAFEDVEEIDDDEIDTLSSRSSLKVRGTLSDNVQTRDKSATSSRSMADSGVFEEAVRNTSGRSQRSLPPLPAKEIERKSSGKKSENVPGKPPSGKKSSARRKLLRIEDDMIDTSLSINQPDSSSPPPPQQPHPTTTHVEHDPRTGQNTTYRPKSRFGNLAFDIVLDTPETGNAKKKPEKLPALLVTKQRRAKKVRTKKDIDKKQEEAAARRKIQEEDKLLKAKQFQHFSICTQVQPFTLDEDEEGDDEADETHVSRIHSAGTSQAALHSNTLPNTNDPSSTSITDMNNNNMRTRPTLKGGPSTPSRSGNTMVEPFHMSDDDDDDTMENTSFSEKVSLPAAVAAC